jgi:hypothetical protein
MLSLTESPFSLNSTDWPIHMLPIKTITASQMIRFIGRRQILVWSAIDTASNCTGHSPESRNHHSRGIRDRNAICALPRRTLRQLNALKKRPAPGGPIESLTMIRC